MKKREFILKGDFFASVAVVDAKALEYFQRAGCMTGVSVSCDKRTPPSHAFCVLAQFGGDAMVKTWSEGPWWGMSFFNEKELFHYRRY